MIKTNWKLPWSRKIFRLVSYTIGLFGVLIPLTILVYTLVSIVSGKGNPYDENGMTVSDVVILNLFCILAVSVICGWIPMLFKYFFPITYEIRDDSGILKINRNGKDVFSASRNEITNVQFITNVVKTSAGTEITRGSQFGDILQIDYYVLRTNGRKKTKQFKMNLAWFNESDRLYLRQFIDSFFTIKMIDEKDKKLKQLAELSGKMKEEFIEKSKLDDKGALSRAGEMTLLMHELKKSQSCQHNWTTDETGRYYCTKCGADGGSAWDC